MRVYFFCTEPGPPERSGYEHGLVALAEGLRELGISVAGNRNLWPIDNGQWLIPQTKESPQEFDVVVISNESVKSDRLDVSNYLSLKKPFRVYVDLSDGWKTEASSQEGWPADLILRAHYNQHFRYPNYVKPWAFGLTNRIIEATAGGAPLVQREQRILCNFRVGHPVRDRFVTQFQKIMGNDWMWDNTIDSTAPKDLDAYRYWALTGRRHNPEYYRRLRISQGCLAFGGYFAPDYRNAMQTKMGKFLNKWIQMTDRQTNTIGQFDSWRFWESLAAGCVTVHVDFDRFGAQLPVQPVKGVHYVAVDRDSSRDELMEQWNSVIENDASRTWAMENYSPGACAKRLLEWIS